jgi:hypothetical protein
MLLAIAGDVYASAGCKNISGKFTLQTVTGPACASAIGICATGSYSGGLKGTGSFAGTSLIQTADTPTTSVVLLTGDNVITTAGGTLLTKDAIVLQTAGAEAFGEVDTVVGGTGEWAGAVGQLTATGTFAASGGQANYYGQVCLP